MTNAESAASLGVALAMDSALVTKHFLNPKISERLNPADKAHCPKLAREALLSSIRQYSDSVRDEWEGEEALICTCVCFSERRIEHEIKTGGLRTIAEVTKACNAGAGCRSCYSLIEDILVTRNL